MSNASHIINLGLLTEGYSEWVLKGKKSKTETKTQNNEMICMPFLYTFMPTATKKCRKQTERQEWGN